MPCACQTGSKEPNDYDYNPTRALPNQMTVNDIQYLPQSPYDLETTTYAAGAMVPGACDSIDAVGILVGGLIIGGLGALFMANMTGETSLFGIARKVKHAGSHTYHSARNTINKK
jgi:hypothetical protein